MTSATFSLADFNVLPADAAEAGLLRCCASRRWAREMISARPFASIEDMEASADRIWLALGRECWLEAFGHHPRIGEKSLREKWSSQEQSGVGGASEETLKGLLEGNRAYEERFGHIFLVCATGKSADEMLALLTARMTNAPDTELQVAVAEHAKITRIRIRKMVHE